MLRATCRWYQQKNYELMSTQVPMQTGKLPQTILLFMTENNDEG